MMAPREPNTSRNSNILVVNKLNWHKCGDELIVHLLCWRLCIYVYLYTQQDEFIEEYCKLSVVDGRQAREINSLFSFKQTTKIKLHCNL
jgi:hypothetical protein